MLNIGLDFINLRTLQDGMGRFAIQFLEGLIKYGSKNEYFIFFNSDMVNQIKISSPNFHKISIDTPFAEYIPENQFYFTFQRKKLPKMDLIHSPVSLPPNFFIKTHKLITTIHGLAFKHFPETCGKKTLLWWNTAWPRCLKRTDHIVAVSHYTKNDFAQTYEIPKEIISVIYNSISYKPLKVSNEFLKSIKIKYKLPEKYILHVGSPHKIKNLITLVKAFKYMTEKYWTNHHLVFVGPKGWDFQTLSKSIDEMNIKDKVTLTGYINPKDLSFIYQGADVFIFPSLYEGFGYPPLEAMACGTPVVASNRSSLKEVIADAGLLVDPLNYKEIAIAVMNIIHSPSLSKELIEKGLKRVKMFSLERKIKSYLEIYKKVASQ